MEEGADAFPRIHSLRKHHVYGRTSRAEAGRSLDNLVDYRQQHFVVLDLNDDEYSSTHKKAANLKMRTPAICALRSISENPMSTAGSFSMKRLRSATAGRRSICVGLYWTAKPVDLRSARRASSLTGSHPPFWKCSVRSFALLHVGCSSVQQDIESRDLLEQQVGPVEMNLKEIQLQV